MHTVPRVESIKDTKSARIHSDVWEAARRTAFEERLSISFVLDRVLRSHFGLASERPDAETTA